MDRRWLRQPNSEEALSSASYGLDEADSNEVEVISRDEFIVMALIDLKLNKFIN